MFYPFAWRFGGEKHSLNTGVSVPRVREPHESIAALIQNFHWEGT